MRDINWTELTMCMKTYFLSSLFVISTGSTLGLGITLEFCLKRRSRAREQEKKNVKARIWKVVRRIVLRYVKNVVHRTRSDRFDWAMISDLMNEKWWERRRGRKTSERLLKFPEMRASSTREITMVRNFCSEIFLLRLLYTEEIFVSPFFPEEMCVSRILYGTWIHGRLWLKKTKGTISWQPVQVGT